MKMSRLTRVLLCPYYSIKIRVAISVIDGLDDAMIEADGVEQKEEGFGGNLFIAQEP